MITILSQRCIGCGLCVRDCFPHYLALTDGKAQVSGERCMACGHCVAICPQNAVQMTGYEDGIAYPAEERTVAPDVLAHFMQWRRSVRQFQERAVSQELLSAIIEAGRLTPTGSNSQSPAYIVLQNDLPRIRQMAVASLYQLSQNPANPYKDSLARIYHDAQAGRDSLFHGAPAVIVVLDRQMQGINGALAASRMELMANALGLGVCFVGFFVRAVEQSEALRQLLQIDETSRVITSLAIGYPAVTYQRTAPRQAAVVSWR